MTPPPQIMSDFRDNLEHHLRRRAAPNSGRRFSSLPARRIGPFTVAGAAVAAAKGTPRRRRTAAAGITVVAATTVAVFAGLGSNWSGSPDTAFGQPRILDQPTQDMTGHLKGGLLISMALGDSARLDEAIPFPALGGTAYLITGKQGWCLTAPDPATDHPDIERGATCAPAQQLTRIGMYLTIGRNFVAVIPRGAPAPELTTADGESRRLVVSAHDTVAVENLAAGDRITLHGRDENRVVRIS